MGESPHLLRQERGANDGGSTEREQDAASDTTCWAWRRIEATQETQGELISQVVARLESLERSRWWYHRR